MTNSGDVDDAEADYTCPSWIRAFDVRCIFVEGVVRSRQEKQREGVIPNTSPALCSNTATSLLTTYASRKQTERCSRGTKCSLCSWCHSLSLYFTFTFTTNTRKGSSFGSVRELFSSLWSQSAPVAWHHISPCLLVGTGIYCNAIVLDRIGPVLTLMMPSSLNLESLLLSWRRHVGTAMYWGEEWKDVRHPSDPIKTICMLVIQTLFLGGEEGVDLWLSTTDCHELAT